MKIFFMFILFIFGASDLDYFIDKEIRIFLSSANHIFLGFKKGDEGPSVRSKFSNLKEFLTLARIYKDGDSFRIKLGSEYICADSDKVVKCGQNKKWKIVEKPFGYLISQGSKCLTLVSKQYFSMIACTGSREQIFDFRYADEDQLCGNKQDKEENDDNKNKKENIFIINIDDKLRNNYHKMENINEENIDQSKHLYFPQTNSKKRNDFVDLTIS